MSQIIYPITHLPPVIDIGKQTEKGVTRIGFDVHEWLDDWPGMAFSVQPTRPGETESYLAASEMVGSVVFWLVGAVDTEKPGSGTVEVLGVTEDERKLSFMCRTAIANTNTVTTAEIPEQNRPWVDQVILAADSAAKSATESEASADKAAASAKEAEESVQDFFVVTAAPKKEGVPVLYADKTQDEIRAAVAAGKTCLLVYHADTTLVSAGTVCLYFGEGKYDTSEAESPSFFAGVKYDTRYSLWYQYVAYVRADGHVGVTGNPIKTPAPQKLKFTGAVEAEYDGSSAVTVEIPSGSLPETADPLKQLVTDESGKVAWEDRLAYETVAEVVNLEPTELVGDDDNGDGEIDSFFLLSPWLVDIKDGGVYEVTYNGVLYECPALKVDDDGMTFHALGNFALANETGGNPDAPFYMFCLSKEDAQNLGGRYAMLATTDGATSVTISVRGVEHAIKTIDPKYLPKQDVLLVTVDPTTLTFDHPYDDVYAALLAGKTVQIRAGADGRYNVLTPISYSADFIGLLSVAYADTGFESTYKTLYKINSDGTIEVVG